VSTACEGLKERTLDWGVERGKSKGYPECVKVLEGKRRERGKKKPRQKEEEKGM